MLGIILNILSETILAMSCFTFYIFWLNKVSYITLKAEDLSCNPAWMMPYQYVNLNIYMIVYFSNS